MFIYIYIYIFHIHTYIYIEQLPHHCYRISCPAFILSSPSHFVASLQNVVRHRALHYIRRWLFSWHSGDEIDFLFTAHTNTHTCTYVSCMQACVRVFVRPCSADCVYATAGCRSRTTGWVANAQVAMKLLSLSLSLIIVGIAIASLNAPAAAI